MRANKILLILYICIYTLVPLLTWQFVTEGNRRFEEEERIARAQGGEVYGDCSGVSVILPFLFVVHAIFFLIGSVISLCLAGKIKEETTLIKVVLIGVLGALPSTWIIFMMVRALLIAR